MINIKLVCVGKIKESFHKEEIGEYLKRLSKYCKINIFEVEEYLKAKGLKPYFNNKA